MILNEQEVEQEKEKQKEHTGVQLKNFYCIKQTDCLSESVPRLFKSMK